MRLAAYIRSEVVGPAAVTKIRDSAMTDIQATVYNKYCTHAVDISFCCCAMILLRFGGYSRIQNSGLLNSSSRMESLGLVVTVFKTANRFAV